MQETKTCLYCNRVFAAERTRLLVADGWIDLRFWNREIRDNLPNVLQAIWN